jgi:DNA polymerase/3'-5' exonuclease PolX
MRRLSPRALITRALGQRPPSNAEIADRLASLAQLSAEKGNRYKVKAYQRAAARIRNLPESLRRDGPQ